MTGVYRSAEAYANAQRLSREAKRRRTGICENCGGVTRYGGRTPSGVSRMCLSCSTTNATNAYRGNGRTQKRLFALLAEHDANFTTIKDTLGITSSHAGSMLNYQLKQGNIVRVKRGIYRLASQ